MDEGNISEVCVCVSCLVVLLLLYIHFISIQLAIHGGSSRAEDCFVFLFSLLGASRLVPEEAQQKWVIDGGRW